MPRAISDITLHIRSACANPNIKTTLIQTEDLIALCDLVEGKEPMTDDEAFNALKTLAREVNPSLPENLDGRTVVITMSQAGRTAYVTAKVRDNKEPK